MGDPFRQRCSHRQRHRYHAWSGPGEPVRLFGLGGVPAPVRARLARGERVLTHAPVATGRDAVLTATTRALYLPDGHRLAWENIDRARWSIEDLLLVEEGV